MMTAFKASATASVCLLLLLASGRAQNRTQIRVKNARPIYEIVLKLRSAYGWPVNYEEHRYVFRGEPKDDSETGRRLLAHGERELTLDVQQPGYGRKPSESDSLERLVSTYNDKYGPEFELRKEGNRYSIVGVRAKDQLGRYGQEWPPILDTVVTLDPAERDGYALLKDLCAELRRKTGIRVVIGLGPVNSLRQIKILRGFSAPAREIIAEVLDQTRVACRSSWSLLYGPSDDTFGLNIGVVFLATDSPDPCSH